MVATDLPQEILDDPELYGLRRSRRAHTGASNYAEELDNNEDEFSSRKKKSRNNGASHKKKRMISDDEDDDMEEDDEMMDDVEDDDEDDDDDDDDEEFTIGKGRTSKTKFGKKKNKKKMVSTSPSTTEVRFSTRNNNRSVNYNIENDDDEFLESDDGEEDYYYYDNSTYSSTTAIPQTTEGIDQVMNHKIILDDDDEKEEEQLEEAEEKMQKEDEVSNDNSSATEDQSREEEEAKLAAKLEHHKRKVAEKEHMIGSDMNKIKQNYKFLIKWNEKSHLHNTWEYYADVVGMKGIKKIDNYIKQSIILPYEITNDPMITREELELISIERERKLGEINECKTIERIVDSRRENNPETGENELQYFVKWKRLHYDECTWEDAAVIAELNPHQVTKFQNRMKSKILPNLSANYGHQRPPFEKLVTQPVFIKNGELRDFQLTGLNWMAFLWSRNENGILADEMGLGKTVQTVSFLSWLIYARRQNGPHLVVVPLSTMPAWQETFDKWAPDVNVVYYMGNTKARKVIRENEWYQGNNKKKPKFNVLLTTYEYVLKDRNDLANLKWQFLAVDEAHRLKNAESSLYEALKSLKVNNRLLITGTPLQNNIKELAALVNFLMPGKFTIDQEIDFDSPDDQQEEYIRELHKRLQPFILRRLKKDVEKSLPSKTERILRVELSDMQTQYYKNILTKNYAALNAGSKGVQISLLNIMSELKKASNHPYLFDNAEEQVLTKAGSSSRENILKGLIMSSGKMVLLDKLLTRLKKDGHRVLIFSQMVRILDILGDYLSIKGYNFQRLDGTVPSFQRRISIDHYNAKGSKDFVFLLSTRAGGLGINLMTADTVIIFDSDWNPQADLQAMARAHRIGQKNHVMVYRFVSKDTVEEQVLERARKKMILEYAIISLGVTDNSSTGKVKTEPTTSELSEILKFGAGNMFKANENQKKLEDLNLDDVLEHAEDHITTPDLGESNLGGEEFLKQFEVTDYKADVDWDDIIPEEELQKLKEDEKKRQDEEMMREQMQLFARREQALKNMKNMYDDGTNDDEDESARKSRLKKRKLNDNIITEKEVRNIYRAILRMGDINLFWDQLIEDGSLSNKSPELLKETYKQLVGKSKELVKQEEERRSKALKELEEAANKQRENESKGVKKEEGEKDAIALWKLKRKEHKAVLFDFHGAKNLNAELILNRPSDMKLIRDTIGKTPVSEFRLGKKSKTVHGWNCEWNQKDDEMLLYGLSKFGYGSWIQIRDDPLLGLGNKMFLNNETMKKETANSKGETQVKEIKKVPNSVHLSRRADYLIVLLRGDDGDDNESTPAPKKALKKAKKSATPDVKPGSAEPKNSRGTSASNSNSSSSKKIEIKKLPKEEPEYSEYESMDDNVCKERLYPVKRSLKRLSKGAASLPRKEWATILKKELLAVGDKIEEEVSHEKVEAREQVRKHLWVFTSYFWPIRVSSKRIAAMYKKVRQSTQS
ncbi:chromatin-remodeling ATPase [Saccharomycopsis crataegensis]|uniref:Chromatin-remodeling ATPase n=1 Tax=Saccharomycopsis crataegensis TaxID=43959 RepID=A0AAV5QU85_9ASCO|nr:chromatin-remodeling ATPase [Saccharomycopsis crataegensis]